MTVLLVLSLLCSGAVATPAIVWKSLSSSHTENGSSNNPLYTSHEVKAVDLVAQLQPSSSSSSEGKLSVLFVLARDTNGAESLTATAPLLTQSMIATAATNRDCVVHQHVSGVPNAAALVRQFRSANDNEENTNNNNNKPMLCKTLTELDQRLNETTLMLQQQQLQTASSYPDGVVVVLPNTNKKNINKNIDANVFVVHVASDTAPESLDAAVARALADPRVATVAVTAVRGFDEVHHERRVEQKRRFLAASQPQKHQLSSAQHGRRLDEAQDNNANANDASTTTAGVYFVSMTPNMLAGILFFGLFMTVTWIGISCMGMISGQELYVNKMPTIGREA